MDQQGLQLTVDAYGCPRRLIDSESFVEHTLLLLLEKIKMTRVGGPHTVRIGQKPGPSGISCIVVLAESHISIHTYPEIGFFSMDIYSCKSFDVEEALNLVNDRFKVKKAETNIIPRIIRQQMIEATVKTN